MEIEDNTEMTTRKLVWRRFLAMLETIAINKSHSSTPAIIAELNIINCVLEKVEAVLAITDPYMPSQNKMVSGLDMDKINPDRKDFIKVTLPRELLIKLDFPDLSRLSMPVYVKTKKPNSHKNVLMIGISIK
jgi:hypothetical protein